MFPPPKPASTQQNWEGGLEVIVSLQDEDESFRPMSTLSKKKKVKKLKTKNASVQPEFLKPPAYPEVAAN